jgi:hypothetical protein
VDVMQTAPPVPAEPLPAEMPPVPDDIRQAARLAPNRWLDMVNPAWSGEGPPPYLELVGPPAYEIMPIAALLNRIPEEHLLYLNPSGPVPVAMPVESVGRRLQN